MWAMLAIWLVGVLTIIKVRKFHICAVYVISFLFFAWIRSLMGEGVFLAEIAPLTGPMYQLFILFMITDPRTVGSTRKGEMCVAFLFAVVEMVFSLGEALYVSFFVLFIVDRVVYVSVIIL